MLYTDGMSIVTPLVPPNSKKSHKGLIITLISVGVGVFVILTIAGLSIVSLLAPSARLCSGTYAQGQNVKHGLSNSFDIKSYGYDCISGDAPTSQSQQVTISATSNKLYSSRTQLSQRVTSELSAIGWSPRTLAGRTTFETDTILNQNAVYYQHDEYTLRLDVYSYDPALIKVSITMDKPSVNFGIVIDKTPKNISATYRPDATIYTSVPMYVSAYVPEGFEKWTVVSMSSDSIYRNIPLVSSDSYLEATGSSDTVVLQTVRVPAGFSITDKCDVTIQDHAYTCVPIGAMKDGTVIYSVVDTKSKAADRVVAIINGYLVYLGNTNNRIGPVKSTLPITTDTIINVYNKLTYTNQPAKY